MCAVKLLYTGACHWSSHSTGLIVAHNVQWALHPSFRAIVIGVFRLSVSQSDHLSCLISKHQDRQQQKQVLSNEWVTPRWLYLLYTVFSTGTPIPTAVPTFSPDHSVSAQVKLLQFSPAFVSSYYFFSFFSRRSCQQLTCLCASSMPHQLHEL